jgi:hypothetical protein
MAGVALNLVGFLASRAKPGEVLEKGVDCRSAECIIPPVGWAGTKVSRLEESSDA